MCIRVLAAAVFAICSLVVTRVEAQTPIHASQLDRGGQFSAYMAGAMSRSYDGPAAVHFQYMRPYTGDQFFLQRPFIFNGGYAYVVNLWSVSAYRGANTFGLLSLNTGGFLPLMNSAAPIGAAHVVNFGAQTWELAEATPTGLYRSWDTYNPNGFPMVIVQRLHHPMQWGPVLLPAGSLIVSTEDVPPWAKSDLDYNDQVVAIIPGAYQCANGADDDHDGLVDMQDPGCSSPQDNNEGDGTTQCQDGRDNDGDGAVDLADFSCQGNRLKNDELNPKAQCQDGADNDGDGTVDFPSDKGCSSKQDNLEQATMQISKTGPASVVRGDVATFQVTVVNAAGYAVTGASVYDASMPASTFVAQGSSPECKVSGAHVICGPKTYAVNESATYTIRMQIPGNAACNSQLVNQADVHSTNADSNWAKFMTTVTCPPPPQCQDGVDNDGDGATDYPADFSCSSGTDNDETNPKAQCQDGIDNDGDGTVDFPSDKGCTSKQDDSEAARMDIVKTGPATVKPGEVAVYEVTVKNLAGHTVNGAAVYDASMPASTFVAQGSSPECKVSGAHVVCGPKSYAHGEVKTYVIKMQVPANAACGGQLVNQADVHSTNGDSNWAKFMSAIACPKQCEDKKDNDGDGAIDHPADFSCSSPTDDDESDPKSQCQDGADNDYDGQIDYPADPGCESKQDNDERSSVQCDDGKDNDGDGKTDLADPGCRNPSDNDETSQCHDKQDNDGDGAVDYPADFSCKAPYDDDELNEKAQCQDGSDNDADGKIDYPADPGCESKQDDSETGGTQCEDGKDNDGDGKVDSKDPGCSGPTDDDETTQCQDKKDNDSDGATDFGADFSCSSVHDDDEANPKSQCQDGTDNDGDGKTDFPADVGCESKQDNSEYCDFQCDDGKDNDGDGKVDSKDPGCSGPTDNDEQTQCQDKKDNDSDGAVDFGADFSCSSVDDDDEANPKAQCQDGADNDGDGKTDYPADPGCESKQDNTETGGAQCDDGKDNDGDGKVDTKDPGCSDPADDDEATQCQDKKDNDSDGAVDFGADFSCASADDDDEENPKAQCQDGTDNDADGKIDHPADPGCESKQDDTETGAAQCDDGKDNDGDGKVDTKDPGCADPSDNDEQTQCQDKKDNDSDGAIDFGADFSCSSADDDDEENPKSQCQDGSDNDGDGKTDFPADVGCESKQDDSEYCDFQCDDGKDNDGDGKVDTKDPGCSGPTDNDEQTQCQDKKDNDSDGATDFGADFSCSSPHDDDEENPKAQCQDGIDNDSDGNVDYPADKGCDSKQDDTEEGETKQCSDGSDNDGDGASDAADFGCKDSSGNYNPKDDDESNPKAQCQDGIDNDEDGKIDFPADKGCDSNQDNDELDPILPVEPQVTCVFDNSDGSYTAVFGYSNPNAGEVTVEAGLDTEAASNKLEPAPAKRGQISSFQPGIVSSAFTIEFDGEPLTWTLEHLDLGEKSATASKESAPCKPIEPVLECVDINADGTLRANFGYQNDNEFDVVIAPGSHNGFTPAPTDRGQIDTFFKGRLVNVFSVDFNGEDIVWRLGGLSVTASRSSKLCSPNQAPTCDAGDAYQLSCAGTVTNVALDGGSSVDPDGTKVFHLWETNCPGATIDNPESANPTLSLTGPGEGVAADCTVTLTLTDGVDVSTCQQSVKVSACAMDCSGVVGGGAEVDQCGVCGGDGTSCLDCSGIPFGTTQVDKCGVCGGNDSCLDCKGIPNGDAAVDRCGVCGGDGQSCLQCVNTDISDNLAVIAAGEQFELLTKQSESLEKDEKRDPRIRVYDRSIARRLARGQIRYDYLKELIAVLPNVVVNCANANFCSEVDNGATIEQAHRYTRKLWHQIGRTIEQQLLPRRKERALKAKNNRLYYKLRDRILAIPRFGSKCE